MKKNIAGKVTSKVNRRIIILKHPMVLFAVFISLILMNLSAVEPSQVNQAPVNEQPAADYPKTISTYSIQVGAYSKRSSAVVDAKKLEKHEIECIITQGKRLFKLFCGKLESREAASKTKEKITLLGYKDSFVLKLKSKGLIKKFGAPDNEKHVSQIKSVPAELMTKKTEKPETEKEVKDDIRISDPEIPDESSSVKLLESQDTTLALADPQQPEMLRKEESLQSDQLPDQTDTSLRGKEERDFQTYKVGFDNQSIISDVLFSSKKNLIVISSVVLVLITALFFILLIVFRRIGAVQAFKARKILKRQAELFSDFSDDPESIDHVVEKLKSIGNSLFIEQIIDKAATESTANNGLRALYDATGVTDKYMEVLKTSKSWKKRAFACEKLGHIGSGKSVPSLLNIIRDVNNEDEDVRMVALRSLGRIRDKRAISALIEALGFPETWLPPRVGEILVNIGKDCIEPLKKELKNFQSENRRGWAAEILGWLNAKNAVAELMESLLDASPEVRGKAAGALGKIKDVRAISKLTELLISEPVPFVRTRVSQALGSMGDPTVIHYLVNILKDPEWWVRVRAVEALEQLGDKSIPSLLIAMEDEDKEVRRRSALALERVGYISKILEEYGQDKYKPELRKILFLVAQAGVIESLSEKLNVPDINMKKRIVRLFGEAKTNEASEPLVELLKETDDWTLKARIIQSLGKVGAKESIPLLIENLKDNEYWVRRAAVEALGMLEASEFSDDIALLLSDPNPQARESAVSSLMMLKVTHHWDQIEKLLFDPAPKVRSTALKAIRTLGITTDRSKILETLTESSEEVRIEAIKYFSSTVDPEVLSNVLRLLPYGTEELRKEIVEYVKRIRPEKFDEIRDLFNINALSREALVSLMEVAAVVKDQDAYQFILSFTGSPDSFLRENAFRSMAEFGFSRHEEIFEKALFDPARTVRTIVLACVGSETSDAFLDKAKVLAKDPDENVRLALCLAFGASGFKQFKHLIIGMLGDPSQRVVTGAFISLASLNDPMFLEVFYAKKNIKEIRNEIQRISEDERFISIIHDIKKKAEQSRNLEVEMIFAKNDRTFANELVKKLKESLDPVIRIKAMEMLKLTATPDLFTSILSVMKKDPYADVRIEAMDVVTSIGREEEVITALSSTLADPSPDVRSKAAELLGKHKNPKALEALLHVLDTPDRDFREAVTTSLSELLTGDPEKVTELLKSVPETKTRKIGLAWLMGKSRKKGSMKFLMDLLDDVDPEVRAAATGALGKFKKKQLFNALEKLIYDPNERVRAAAVNAIAAIGGERAFEIVEGALHDIDDFVRTRATIGIAKLNIKRAISVLQGKTAKYPEFDSDLKGLLFASGESYEDPAKMSTSAINIVADLCDKEAMMKIFERSSDREKRLHAFRVLTLIGSNSNHDLLSKALKDPAPEIRQEANKHTIDLG